MDVKNEVLKRAYMVLALLVVLSLGIFTKTAQISVIQGPEWRSLGDSLYIDMRPVDAQRGNILANDGSLLATSLPFFEIRMDLNSSGMSDKDFEENVDSLGFCLATYVNNSYTIGGMQQMLRNERAKGTRYLLIKKKATLSETERIRKFPLFNLGQYRGGLIVKRKSERKRPFKILAHRTIGYIREGSQPVGLEGSFDEVLSGKEGRQAMYRVGLDTWMPLDDLTEIEPHDGKDVVTTVDVDLQDIVETALIRGVRHHKAKHGSAVLMEVKTGAIKAIANIGESKDGYWETYNYAVGSATEPGSTFKLASIMALLEDGYVNLNDTINLEQGVTTFYEEEMKDASFHQLDTTTVRKAFEISSNVGIAKLIQFYYGEKHNGKQFIDRINSFGLNLPTGVKIDGEAAPYIKKAYNSDDHWSGTTLPWMSTGYELTITPLQMLSFYNSVANNGVMMKPYLVKEIQEFGAPLETFRPTVIKKKIASDRTIGLAKSLLKGVVERGTAQKLKTEQYTFAGKTGTAQLDYQKLKARTAVGGYQASFVGYFPAEKPVYSCIVMISNPTENGFYGSSVAGPVFREISDKLFASRPELQNALTNYAKPRLANHTFPKKSIGASQEMNRLLDYFDVDYVRKSNSAWTSLVADRDTLKAYPRKIVQKKVPDVIGMGLRDALFVLENLGMRVKVRGVGKVKRQSIKPQTKIRGQRITITLG